MLGRAFSELNPGVHGAFKFFMMRKSAVCIMLIVRVYWLVWNDCADVTLEARA